MIASECAHLFDLLSAAYPRQELKPKSGMVYAQFFADLTLEEGTTAVSRHIATSPFFPAISEIRELVIHARVGFPSAEVAWAELIEYFGDDTKSQASMVPKPTNRLTWESARAVSLDYARFKQISQAELNRVRVGFLATYEKRLKSMLEAENAKGLNLPSGIKAVPKELASAGVERGGE